MTSPSRSLLLVALAVVLLSAGCVSPAGGGDPDPASLAERVENRLDSVETMEMTMRWEIAGENGSESFTTRVAYEAPDRMNLTYRSPEPMAGARLVNNGSTVVAVNPRSNTYAVSAAAGPGASLSALYLNAADVPNATFHGNETVAGTDATKISYAVEGSEVSMFLQGGTDASRLSEGADDDANVTLWIDRERWVPVKATVEYTGFETPLTITLSYEDISLDEGLPAERFRTTPSENAVRVDSIFQALDPENVTGYATHDAAAADAGALMPPATLPDGHEFVRGFRVALGEEARYRFFYTNGTANREVHATTAPIQVLSGRETATVDGRTVNASTVQGEHIFEWNCADSTYLLIGTGTRDALREAAPAVGCPED